MTAELKPVFAYPPHGPLLRKNDLARCIAAAGVPSELARSRVHSYAHKGLLHVRARGENGWESRLWEFHDAATAVVLSALHDAGISDSDVTARAADACYAWNPDAASRDAKYKRDGGHLPPHPITRAVVGTAFAGESWIFNLDVWRNARTEDRLICADLLRWGDEYQPFPNPPEGFLPMCAVSMALDHLLAPVARLLRPEGLH